MYVTVHHIVDILNISFWSVHEALTKKHQVEYIHHMVSTDRCATAKHIKDILYIISVFGPFM